MKKKQKGLVIDTQTIAGHRELSTEFCGLALDALSPLATTDRHSVSAIDVYGRGKIVSKQKLIIPLSSIFLFIGGRRTAVAGTFEPREIDRSTHGIFSSFSVKLRIALVPDRISGKKMQRLLHWMQ